VTKRAIAARRCVSASIEGLGLNDEVAATLTTMSVDSVARASAPTPRVTRELHERGVAEQTLG